MQTATRDSPPRRTPLTHRFLLLIGLYVAFQLWTTVYWREADLGLAPSGPAREKPRPDTPYKISEKDTTKSIVAKRELTTEKERTAEARDTSQVVSMTDVYIVVGTLGVTMRWATSLFEASGVPVSVSDGKDLESKAFRDSVAPLLRTLWSQKEGWSWDSQVYQGKKKEFRDSILQFYKKNELKYGVNGEKSVLIDSSQVDIWAFQSLHAVFMLPILKDFFPNAKIVHVIEDGRYAALDTRYRMIDFNSIIKIAAPKKKILSNSQKDKSRIVSHLWNLINLQISENAPTVYGGNYHVVKIEDSCVNFKESIVQLVKHFSIENPVSSMDEVFSEFKRNRMPDWKTTCTRPIGLYRQQKLFGAPFLRALENITYPGLLKYGYASPENSTYLLNKDDLFRVANHVSKDKFLIVTFVTSAYHRLLFNWLIGMRRIEVESILPICLDLECSSFLKSIPVIHFFDATICCPSRYYDILDMRTQYIRMLLDLGFDVIISDADALWSRNPLPVLFQQHTDLQAMAGKFPNNLYKKWKWGTMNCGLVFFRSTDASKLFLDKMMFNMRKQADDQISANQVFDQNNITWTTIPEKSPKCILGNCNFGRVESMNLTVTLMDKRLFITACRSNEITDEPPFVIHAACTEKEEQVKVEFLQSMKVWFLKDSWMGMRPQSPPIQWNYSSPSSTLSHIIRLQAQFLDSIATIDS